MLESDQIHTTYPALCLWHFVLPLTHSKSDNISAMIVDTSDTLSDICSCLVWRLLLMLSTFLVKKMSLCVCVSARARARVCVSFCPSGLRLWPTTVVLPSAARSRTSREYRLLAYPWWPWGRAPSTRTMITSPSVYSGYKAAHSHITLSEKILLLFQIELVLSCI